AIPLAERYVALAHQKHGDNHTEYATAISWLANIYQAQGRYAEAEPLCRPRAYGLCACARVTGARCENGVGYCVCLLGGCGYGGSAMHARFGEVKVKAGKLDEFVKIFRDEMMPHGRSQKGFKGVTVLADAMANRAVLISYWETEADARAAGQSSGSFQGQI